MIMTGIVGRQRCVLRRVKELLPFCVSVCQTRQVATEASASPAVPSGKKVGGKRFFRKAHVRHAEHGMGYEVMLDHRVLKTPAKNPLCLHNEALALAIAAEWEWQDSSGVRAFTMPLMRLASIAIDQIPKDREAVIASLLKYCHTDSICLRSEKVVLAEKQALRWDPLCDWIQSEIGAKPVVSSSIFGINQPQQYVTSLEAVLRSFNHWQLAAVDSLAGSARSVVVALAIVQSRLSIDDAIETIRLEEDHQVEEWGFVEGGHDIDVADLRVRISAASVFSRLLKISNHL